LDEKADVYSKSFSLLGFENPECAIVSELTISRQRQWDSS